ncbi:MAG: membrane protein insertase YidC [Clostridia bacterium]|nr:membrane protein insertase YidC [Clostridia bacterium]
MDKIMYYVCIPFGYIMKWCYQLVGNYGIAIILFTLATKLVLLPISVWIHKNSILMVKIQPEINFMKARLHGNMDAIADEQAKIFKREHYHPMLSLVPLLLQIFLLLAVVYIIYHPMNYLLGISDQAISSLATYLKLDVSQSSYQLYIIDAIKSGTITASLSSEIGLSPAVLGDIISKVNGFNLNFIGINLSIVPAEVWGWFILVPIVAGASSWFMSFTQNASNVIQHEQSKINQYTIMAISVGLSLYLGLFVPTGLAIYWVSSNLLSVLQMYCLNAVINPKKYVDHDALEQSRKVLNDAKSYGKIDKHDPLFKKMKKREKVDYKAFMRVANKHIVIYSEKSGFYKYFKDVMDEMLKRSNVVIHYVTNDYNDQIFEVAKKEPRIKPYYISLKKTILLMMMVETDVFIMTTPDLNKYYLKKSFTKKDIEYIYIPHDSMSAHKNFNEGAFDEFNTILCVGKHFVDEIRAIEKLYKLPAKNLVEFGFPLLDNLVETVKAQLPKKTNKTKKEILIAPSWQEENILESCIDTIIEKLYSDNYHITVRPHPEFVKRFGYKLNQLVNKYSNYDKDKLTFELDFSSNSSVYNADLMITDWSGIAAEYSFATGRPTIFINTKMKVNNPNWQNIDITPIEIKLRSEIGIPVDLDNLVNIDKIVSDAITNAKKYKEKIEECFKTFTFNHGTAAKVGADYILKSIINKQQKAKEKN